MIFRKRNILIVPEMTHSELVKQATYWLRYCNRHTIVLTELRTHGTETPDCIGFQSTGHTTLIECKTSRSDFLVDMKKHFRGNTSLGMGIERYYLAPYNLLKPEELPEKWGLIEVAPASNGGFHRDITKKAIPFDDVNKEREISMLVSVIRRLEISTAVFIREA